MSSQVGLTIAIGAVATAGALGAFKTVGKEISTIGTRIAETQKKSNELGKALELMKKQQELTSKAGLGNREAFKELIRNTEKFRQAESVMRKYGSSVKESERALEKLGKRLDRLNKADAVVKSLSNTVKNAQIGSAITFAGLGNVVSAGMDFEASMSRVGAVSGADPEQMKAMTDQARKLGAETVWSATQAAEGMQFLAMAGFKTEEILKTMPGMLDLASAGAIDLGRAADIASNILTGFGLEAEQMGRVGDILTNTFTTSNVDLEMLGQKVFLRAELPMECSRAETDPAFSSICFWHP